jgi:hypothetical protein
MVSRSEVNRQEPISVLSSQILDLLDPSANTMVAELRIGINEMIYSQVVYLHKKENRAFSQ